MTIQLDHLMVPSRNKVASAKLLGELLGVPWSATGIGPFAPVYVNDGLTIDLDEQSFDAILSRIKSAGIPYRSNVHGPADPRVNTDHGGRIVYWNEPDGHQWEMLTESYARRA